MKKKVLVLTDSLGLPRDTPEYCSYENTWPQLLKEKFDIHQVSIGGGTIDQITGQLDYHKLFNPDIIILQSGIVDCAPRALTKFENELFNKFFVTRKILNILLPKYSNLLRLKRNKKYTDLFWYSKNIEKVISTFKTKKVYALSILEADDTYHSKVPGIRRSIGSYNSVLKEKLMNNYIDLSGIDRKGVMSDSMHLNEEGHRYIYSILIGNIL